MINIERSRSREKQNGMEMDSNASVAIPMHGSHFNYQRLVSIKLRLCLDGSIIPLVPLAGRGPTLSTTADSGETSLWWLDVAAGTDMPR